MPFISWQMLGSTERERLYLDARLTALSISSLSLSIFAMVADREINREGGCLGLSWRTPEAQDSTATFAGTGFGIDAKALGAFRFGVSKQHASLDYLGGAWG